MNGDVEALAEVLWLADGYDLNADPKGRTAREMRPEYEERARTIAASPWLAARIQAARAEELEQVRDALYRGEGPDMVQDSDIIYGEWIGNRADQLRAALRTPDAAPEEES